MSKRVQDLRAAMRQLGAQIEAAVNSEFPVGARIRWTSHGIDNRIGRVEGYGGFLQDTRLRVRTERTDKLVAVHMYCDPEVLPE